MKKYILSAAVAALSMISCQKELADPTQPDQAPVAGELVEMTFSASVETDDTKTYIDAADGFKAFWEASDKIAVYADAQKTEQPFAVTEGSASGTFAYFRGTAPEGASAYYAVYPAAAAGECADGKVNVTIPAVQTLSGHTTASGALVSVAKAEGDALAFKNVCALMKVKVAADDITEIVLQGKNDELIAGTVKVDAATGVLSEVVEGSKMITFKPEGETFAQGDYYIALLPTAFTKGFDLVLSRAADSKRSIKETTKQLTIARSAGKNLGTVTSGYAYEWVNVIMNAAELTAFNAVSAATTNADVWVLGADVDYGSENWKPVVFNGVFVGRNLKIYNILVDLELGSDAGFASFFSVVGDGDLKGAVVKNLVYGSSDGVNWDKVSVLKLKRPEGNSTVLTYSGLIGRSRNDAVLSNLVNFAEIEVKEGDKSYNLIGGIVANAVGTSSVTSCVNHATITNNSAATAGHHSMGGIIGKSETTSVISGCFNYGSITNNNKQVRFLGGIVGNNGAVVTISNCENHGAITCKSATNTIELDCGGIIGIMDKNTDKVSNCHNYGTILTCRTAPNLVGGIVGVTKSTSTIENCSNSGSVSSTVNTGSYHGVGGILGFDDQKSVTTLTGCENKKNSKVSINGAATGDLGCGGIIGISTNTILTGNTNNGVVEVKNTSTANTRVGGICGWDFESAIGKFENNTNNAEVYGEGTAVVNVGGVIGWNQYSVITLSNNTGAVSGKGGTLLVGSVAGNNAKTITNCQAAGSVNGTTLDKDNYASYIQGTGSAGTATGCYFAK